MLLVAPEDLVSGLPGDAELPTHMAHRLAFQEAGHETQALVHHRTLFPRHCHLPPAVAGGRCYPCVRNKTSPMSRVGHTCLSERLRPSHPGVGEPCSAPNAAIVQPIGEYSSHLEKLHPGRLPALSGSNLSVPP